MAHIDCDTEAAIITGVVLNRHGRANDAHNRFADLVDIDCARCWPDRAWRSAGDWRSCARSLSRADGAKILSDALQSGEIVCEANPWERMKFAPRDGSVIEVDDRSHGIILARWSMVKAGDRQFAPCWERVWRITEPKQALCIPITPQRWRRIEGYCASAKQVAQIG